MLGNGSQGRLALIFAASVVALLLFVPLAAAAPANDAFADAVALSPAPPVELSGTNSEATKEVGEPDHAGDPGGHSVWFSLTPTSTGPVRIGTGCFGNLDELALVAVYTGSSVGTLTPVASNQGFPTPTCFGESAEVEFSADAGTTYWIAVDGKGGAQGSFTLNFNGTPENDDFADAVGVTGELPQVVSGSNKLAGVESGEPDHAGGPGGHSVWYSWTPSGSGPVVISTCSSFFALDTLLAVYTGGSVDSLTQVASNDDAPGPKDSPAAPRATARSASMPKLGPPTGSPSTALAAPSAGSPCGCRDGRPMTTSATRRRFRRLSTELPQRSLPGHHRHGDQAGGRALARGSAGRPVGLVLLDAQRRREGLCLHLHPRRP